MLTERQNTILQIIIQEYTNSGVPVGSKFLANKLANKVSSATVRNEMAVLEQMGLISKTHFSSGRVPSIEGYRYYIDNLLRPDPLDTNDADFIRTSFDTNFNQIDEIVQESAKVLSDLTSYTALTINPDQGKNLSLGRFQLVKLDERQVMAILVTDTGQVENKIFQLDYAPTDELRIIVNIVNDQLVGHLLPEVYRKLNVELPIILSRYLKSPDRILDTLSEMLNNISQDHIFVGGKLNLLQFSENQDIKYLKPLYHLLDNGNDMFDSLKDNNGSDVQVKIGSELSNELLKNYSIITGKYDLQEYGHGLIAVLGPTRMPYSKVIGIVEAMKNEMTKKILGYYGK